MDSNARRDHSSERPNMNHAGIDNALSITADRGSIDRQTVVRGGVAIFAAIVVGLAFVWSFVGALHQPAFPKVPLAVLGPPALSQALSSGGEFSVAQVDSRQAAIDKVDDHDALGGIVVGPRGIDVLVASAAGL